MAPQYVIEAARNIIRACLRAPRGYACGGAKLPDDHPLVVRAVAAIQRAADQYAAEMCEAAPDLLEACKAWLDWAENEHPDGPLMGVAVEKSPPGAPGMPSDVWMCDVCCATWPKGEPPKHADDCPVLMAYQAAAKAEGETL